MNSERKHEVELERRVQALLRSVDEIRVSIESHEVDIASISARAVSRGCDSLNQFANRLADAS